MPCTCSGIRYAKCNCKLVNSGYPFRRDAQTGVVLLAEPYISHRYQKTGTEGNNFLIMIVERLYDKCAGYNLRHCPFRAVVKSDNYLSIACKDFILLCCFFLANFVVFMTIIARMTVHLSFMLLGSAKWIRRRLKKSEEPGAVTRTVDISDSNSFNRN